ncbi:MAG TPA: flagellar basal body rod protein FlgC [Lachnospiraceae bacterium]|jgi:flagellar basal-body rod protein FlgC|nr:flagellar basal-body rod protein FlgC [Butyrivibrio sp. CAG:318]HJI31532.1 flagellar basal body rod protein FlgC [Lachnospiraceae bacterium]
MALFTGMNINASGMSAERLRLDVISENIANANTTRTKEGGPYVRKNVIFTEKVSTADSFGEVLNRTISGIGNGVKVTAITKDTDTDMNLVYEPSHPDADENGYVLYPNVNIVTEMTDLIDASRAFEANTTAFEASKNVASRGLSILE